MKCFFLCLLICTALSSQTILVVGGAGYIGSYVNMRLHQAGYETVVLDNLSCSTRPHNQPGVFIEGDINDLPLLNQLFKEHSIDAVMHFAALSQVGESVKNPLAYYQNNVSGTLTLLEAMLANNVHTIIFSSSCTIFGNPNTQIIDESLSPSPINPYGRTKYFVESILEDISKATPLRYCNLRYFNAAGGDPTGMHKNTSKTERLIPIIIKSVCKTKHPVKVFGRNYSTPDGTCIRDYVHIEDLTTAHIIAMEKLFAGAPSASYNLGNNVGYSVLDVIKTTEQVTQCKAKIIEAPRRSGDAVTSVADSTKARLELDWQPKYTSLRDIITHAWKTLGED